MGPIPAYPMGVDSQTPKVLMGPTNDCISQKLVKLMPCQGTCLPGSPCWALLSGAVLLASEEVLPVGGPQRLLLATACASD